MNIDMEELVKCPEGTELTSESGVVQRAIEAGVNVWAIGRQLTKALEGQQTEDNKSNRRVHKCQKLLDVIRDIMSAHRVDSVEVRSVYCENVDFGEGMGLTKSGYANEEIILVQTGLHIQTFPCSIQNAIHFLYEPMKIVYNLISELTKAAEMNRRLIKERAELEKELGLPFIQAMSDDGENKDLSRST
jgi:hypothetical protein